MMDSPNKDPLATAVENDDPAQVKKLLDIGEDVNCILENPLATAVENEDPAQVRKLLDIGEEVNCILEGNRSLLHLLALKKAILQRDIVVQRDIARKRIVYMLSDAGLDLELRDKDDKTCLHLAVDILDVSLCDVLLQCGADMLSKPQDHESVFNKLLHLEHKFPSNPQILALMNTFRNYQPGIWQAVISGSIVDVRRLINLWCKTDLTRDGRTLKEAAVNTGNEEVIDLIFAIHFTMKLVHHVLACDRRKVKDLLESSRNKLQLDLRSMSCNGAPILYFVLQQKDAAMTSLFIQHDCHIYTIMRDDEGNDMPVFFSALTPDMPVCVLEALLPKNKPLLDDLLSRLIYKGKSILEIAIENDVYTDVLDVLIDRSGPQLISKRNTFNETPRDLAMKLKRKNYVEVIDKNVTMWLLCPEEKVGWREVLALHGYDHLLDIKNWHTENVNESIQAFLQELPHYQDQIKALAEAIEKGDSVTFEEFCIYPNNSLFNCCLSWEGRSVDNNMPMLHLAVIQNKPRIVKSILSKKPEHHSIDTLCDQYNRTALHYAYAMPEADEIRQLLLSSGCSEHVLDKNGKEPLDFKDKAGTPLMIELLSRLKEKRYNLPEPDPWKFPEIPYKIEQKYNQLKYFYDYVHPFNQDWYNLSTECQDDEEEEIEEASISCCIL